MNQLDAVIVSTFISALLKYGLPALAICGIASYFSAKLKSKTRKRINWQNRSSANHWTTNESTPPKVALADLKLKARRPLSPFEEKMFIALSEALPECTVLAQVSFQALLDTTDIADRNRFDRKHADFVICSKRLTPIAVLELDDATHDTRGEEDADRDAMLQNAGYQTIRYRKIPTAEQIQADIEMALQKLTAN
jgi:very-short-patch-repair endonuclease